MFVAMKPTRFPVCMSECHLTSVHDNLRLTTNNGAKTSIKTRLKLAGHQRIVSSCFCENGEVDGEEGEIEDGGNGSEESESGDTIS